MSLQHHPSLRKRARSISIALGVTLAAAAALAACGGDPSSTTSSAAGASTAGSAGSGGGAGDAGAGVGGDLVGGAGGSTNGSVIGVKFDPPSAVLTLDGKTPQDAKFTLTATFQGGGSSPVSPEAIEFDRPDLASLTVGSPLVLTAPGKYAGKGTLHGVYKGIEATAELTVVVHVKDADPSVDPAIVTALDQPNLPADPSLSSLLYPYDATVFPRALSSPLWMWNAPAAGDIYRVHYEEENYTFDGYYPVNLPASARAPQYLWDKIVASNPGGPLQAELRRYDVAGKTAYTSASQKWTIAPASLRGAIYYWTTSGAGRWRASRPEGRGSRSTRAPAWAATR